MTAMFLNSYEKDIYETEQGQSELMAGEISTFLDGAYSVTEKLSVNPSILTMKTDIQTPILANCVARNTYLELLYIQGTNGMQTGRSSGDLADRDNGKISFVIDGEGVVAAHLDNTQISEQYNYKTLTRTVFMKM